MQTTFDDKVGNPADDQDRRVDNTVKATKGEEQVGGAAGRQQAASKDPADYDTAGAGGPGSQGSKPIQDPVV
ncbi:hypothetical protein CBS101457_002407 [Exobasidium rhododendri]|nr:hypothetical protein CBS101457_002407 [Exobasidium rhododendri]